MALASSSVEIIVEMRCSKIHVSRYTFSRVGVTPLVRDKYPSDHC